MFKELFIEAETKSKYKSGDIVTFENRKWKVEKVIYYDNNHQQGNFYTLTPKTGKKGDSHNVPEEWLSDGVIS